MQEFDAEGLPLFVLANWRGFSGGQRDLFEGVLQVRPAWETWTKGSILKGRGVAVQANWQGLSQAGSTTCSRV